MTEALQALLSLQQVDSGIAEATRKFKALDRGEAEEAAARTALERFEQAASAQHASSGSLIDSELELKTVETKKKEFEQKLYSGRVTAFKELESMQQEIEMLGRRQVYLDDRILALMEEVETARRDESSAKAAHEAADKALADRKAAYQAGARRLSQTAKALQAERQARVERVPEALLARYETIRSRRGGVGAAAIAEGLCGACRTVLAKNLVSDAVERGSVVTCDNCGSILCPPLPKEP
jgi:predicted  nucleic acid-binding Zn-ribbon protein